MKTYAITVETELEKNAMEFLKKKSIAKGLGIRDALVNFAISFYEKENNNSKSKEILVTEVELLNIAREKGLSVAKSSVVQYRNKGILRDKNGPWFFQNERRNLVYDLDKMLLFLELRAKAPKSRIKDTKKELGLAK
jgi:hypothetical protein